MKPLNLYVLLGVAVGVSACQSTMPRYEREFGESVRNTLQAQIIHPEAENNADPVKGLDGRAARDSINSYQKSFSKPVPQPSVFNFGVGGTSSNNGTGNQ